MPHFYDSPTGTGTPIYGHVTRMLVDGGGWPGQAHPYHGGYDFKAGTRIPRTKPKVIALGYEGETATEPDPMVSNYAWTLILLRIMKCKHGWSLEDVHQALSHPDNRGGEFYRFLFWREADRAAWLADRYDSCFSKTGNALTPTNPLREGISRGKVLGTWKEIEIRESLANRLIGFLHQGPVTMNQAEYSGVIPRRMVKRYVEFLESQGRLTVTKERWKCRNGATRDGVWVIRLVPLRVEEGIDRLTEDQLFRLLDAL